MPNGITADSPLSALLITPANALTGAVGAIPCSEDWDCARKHQQAMQALSKAHRRAYEVLVLHEIHVAVFGREYYGYRDMASAKAVAYSVLRDALVELAARYEK